MADRTFESLLESLEPDATGIALFREAFTEAWDRLNGSAARDRERQETQLLTLQKRKNKLLALSLDGRISDTDYDVQYAELNGKIAETESALHGSLEALDSDTCCSYLEHLLCNLHILWNQKNPAEKRVFGRLIFPAGVPCSKSGIGTPLTSSLFSLLSSENVQKEELVALTSTENTAYHIDYNTHAI